MKGRRRGFTLMELLVVIAILGILAVAGFSQYNTSIKRGRDAQRKADLSNISKALEVYYNDNSQYPISSDGEISGSSWGSAFSIDVGDDTIIYMTQLPKDPKDEFDYCYESSDGTYFKLYSVLEYEDDADYGSYTCNSESYNYAITSPNVAP